MDDKSKSKIRRILAVVGLVFMAIFTVSFIVVLVDPHLANGAFGYLSLISVLLGAGFFMLVKFVLKDKEPPEYLPDGDDSDESAENEEKERSEQAQSDEPAEPGSQPEESDKPEGE